MKPSDPRVIIVLLAILMASTFAIPVEAWRKPRTTTTPATRATTTTHHARPPPSSSLVVTNTPVRGGGEGHRWKKTNSALSPTNNKKADVASGGSFFSRFRPQATRRERILAAWLLFWNGIALVDALMFTFRPQQNLDGYLLGFSLNNAPHHTLAMTRMLANCQLALIGTIALLACTANESTLKNMFQLLILATLGALRAVAVGVREGSVKPPWKTGYAAVMSAPPLLLLGYFAFVF